MSVLPAKQEMRRTFLARVKSDGQDWMDVHQKFTDKPHRKTEPRQPITLTVW